MQRRQSVTLIAVKDRLSVIWGQAFRLLVCGSWALLECSPPAKFSEALVDPGTPASQERRIFDRLLLWEGSIAIG